VPVIAGMTATAQKTITVTGAQLEKLAASMFTVAGNTVTAVTPSADGTSATLTLGTNLAPETNVKVTATIDGTSKDYTVKYTIAATTVVIQDQTFDYIQANQKVTLLVNGVATTVEYLKEQNYAVSFAAWNSSGSTATTGAVGTALFTNTTDGVIQTPFTADKDFTAQVTISKAGTVVTSAKANIKIRNLNNNISDITAYTLTNYTGTQDKFINTSKTLVVNDQARITKVVVGYGSAAAELTGQTGYSVTSDNSAVASVNSSGVITATGLGTANLTITAGKATYTVPITVTGTVRKAASVALIDGASNFTYVVYPTVNTTRNMTVVVKDQYGDPFVGTTSIGVTIPAGAITGLTSSTTSPITSISVPSDVTKAGQVDIELNNATTAGQSGNAVFRNSDSEVIGSAPIVTSNNNVGTTTKLVVTSGPTDYVIDTELTSKATITVEVHNFNSAGVDLGKVNSLNGYTITCDPSVIAISSATKGTTGYTINAAVSSFNITGSKAGQTTMTVKDPVNVVDSKTVVVTKGTVKITGANFLSPATVIGQNTVDYSAVLEPTKATGLDPILAGIVTTPSTVYSTRITTTGTKGLIYLDKVADGKYVSTDDQLLGRLDISVVSGSGSTGWNSASNSVDGVATLLGNKGNVVFNLIDTVTTPGTDTFVASKSVAVDVPSTLGTVALTADSTSNDVDNDNVITFTDNATWRAAVTSVTCNGTTLTATTDYTLAAGTLTLKPSGGNTALQTAGSKNIVVVASGYSNATVTQVINAGACTSLTVTTQPVLGTRSGIAAVAMSTQPVVKLYDQYNNICSTGSSATDTVTMSLSGATTPAGATLGGTLAVAAVNGVVTYSGVTVTPGSNAQITDLDLTFTNSTLGGITATVTNLSTTS
ncbi:Uncharacterised protein, partial [Acetobacterium wieringae]|uniref:beta strand repeat-containing protein n=1 Tax=Acetobacterium wieringae TaxID=52694 RepID=UPI001E064862